MGPYAAGAWDSTRKFLALANKEKTGLLAFALSWILCLIIVVIFYTILGWPAKTVSDLVVGALQPDCARTNAVGSFGLWMCGVQLALLSLLGAAIVAVVMFLLRARIKKGLEALMQKLPGETHFFILPLVTTIIFTMGWAGVEFHFFDRPGYVRDGVFPVAVGLIAFSTSRYGGRVQPGLAAVYGVRDKLGLKVRIAATAIIPMVLAFLLSGVLHAPKRDQFIVVFSLVLAWVLMSPAPKGVKT